MPIKKETFKLPDNFPKEISIKDRALVYTNKDLVVTFGNIYDVVKLADQEIMLVSVQNEKQKELSAYDTCNASVYHYTAFAGSGSYWGFGLSSCKDYSNDFIFGLAHKNDGKEIFETGIYYVLHFNVPSEALNLHIEHCLFAIQAFLKDIGFIDYMNGVRVISINHKKMIVNFRISKELAFMPPVISTILMLWRNAFLFEKGQEIVDFLNETVTSRASYQETSGYSWVIKFIRFMQNLSFKGVSIYSYFSNDPTIAWNREVAYTYGTHSGFGVKSWMSTDLHKHKNYLRPTYEAPNG